MSLSAPKMVRKKPGSGALARRGLLRLALPVELDRPVAGLGIDIDESPVDLPPGGPILERADGLREGGVGQHRSVDQHRILGAALGGVAWQGPRQKGVPRRPGAMTALQHPVQLAHGEGREGAGEAGGGAGGEDQLGRIG